MVNEELRVSSIHVFARRRRRSASLCRANRDKCVSRAKSALTMPLVMRIFFGRARVGTQPEA